MKFHDFAETLLGSKVKVKVLLYLLRENVASEREIARRLGVSHTAVNKVMKDFSELNLITPLKIGNVNAWSLNKESYAFSIISFTNQQESSDLPKGLERLAKIPPLVELKNEFTMFYNYSSVKNVILYGSIAEGRETADSDIDVFILIENKSQRKVVNEIIMRLSGVVRKKYGNSLAVLLKTVKEYDKMNRSLVKNIERGIVIKG